MCAISDAFFTPYLGHGEAVRIIDPELGTLERETIESNVGGTAGTGGGGGGSSSSNIGGSNINNNGNRKRGMSRRESNSGNLFHYISIIITKFCSNLQFQTYIHTFIYESSQLINC